MKTDEVMTKTLILDGDAIGGTRGYETTEGHTTEMRNVIREDDPQKRAVTMTGKASLFVQRLTS